jgi:hypothetical protein
MKTKNQRLKRRGPPEDLTRLNVRAADTTRLRLVQRRRVVHALFKLAVVIAGLFTVVVLLRHGYERVFIDSPHFTLRRIEIQTNGRTERAKALAAAGLREGLNLLKVDLAKVRTALEALPQVETAEVRRVLPDALLIRLNERVPAAWIACPAAGWRPKSATMGLLADTEGRLFRCDLLTADLLALPVLELDAHREALQPGNRLISRPSLAALGVLAAATGDANPDLPRLAEASIPNGYTLAVRTGEGTGAWLSLEDPRGDCRKLGRILAEFNHGERGVAFANLLPRRNPAVILANSPAAHPANPPAAPRARLVAPPPESEAPPAPPAAPGLPDDLRAILQRG